MYLKPLLHPPRQKETYASRNRSSVTIRQVPKMRTQPRSRLVTFLAHLYGRQTFKQLVERCVAAIPL